MLQRLTRFYDVDIHDVCIYFSDNWNNGYINFAVVFDFKECFPFSKLAKLSQFKTIIDFFPLIIFGWFCVVFLLDFHLSILNVLSPCSIRHLLSLFCSRLWLSGNVVVLLSELIGFFCDLLNNLTSDFFNAPPTIVEKHYSFSLWVCSSVC